MFLILLTFSFYATIAHAQEPRHPVNFSRLDQASVSLRGSDATTVIINHTTDTLKLKGAISYYLPVSEKSVEAVIAPGGAVTLKIEMNYADFIQFISLPFKVYNAPGKNVSCTIENTRPLKLSFSGELAAENKYYDAFFRVAQSNQVYYQVGSQTNNFNKFPALADSINQINLNFLESYQLPLPPSFKQQEQWRLLYNNAFLKHHVLFDKSFKLGQEVKVDTSYYHFDSQIPLVGKQIPLSTAYLWYAVFRLRHQAVKQNKADSLLSEIMLAAAGDLHEEDELKDVIKMRLLYDVYARSASRYDRLISQTNFVNPENRSILDSVSYARFSLPKVGKTAPGFRLKNINGDTTVLSQYKDHLIMINFWAAWCAPCIKEFPAENRLYNTYKGSQKLIVINICLDTPISTWKDLSAKHQLNMVNLFADEKLGDQLKKRYNISALPKSVLIDGNLKVLNNNFKRASQVQLSDLVH